MSDLNKRNPRVHFGEHQVQAEIKATKIKDKLTFDAVGVSEYIKNNQAFTAFRKLALERGVPFKKQAKCASMFLDCANRFNKGVVSRDFVERYRDLVEDIDKVEAEEIGDPQNVQTAGTCRAGAWTLDISGSENMLR